jgi:hypothetical protein
MSVDESSTWAKEAIKKYIVNIGRQDDVQLYRDAISAFIKCQENPLTESSTSSTSKTIHDEVINLLQDLMKYKMNPNIGDRHTQAQSSIIGSTSMSSVPSGTGTVTPLPQDYKLKKRIKKFDRK